MNRSFSQVEERYNELQKELVHPQKLERTVLQEKLKEFKEVGEAFSAYQKLKEIEKKVSEAEEILRTSLDKEFLSLAEEEIEELRAEKEKEEKKIREFLSPSRDEDKRNAIFEIRAGVGGEEASLFVKDLFRMYSKYVEKEGLKLEIFDSHPTERGGFREITFSVKGKNPFSLFKYEGGTHRVQRIPLTEASGRVHTSTAMVSVFPEIEERELKINPKEIKIDTFCSSGPGGQSVNTAYSAIRITHLPTGIVISCQDERSQLQNKLRALKVLRARLKKKRGEEEKAERREERFSQVGRGERSDKIRTYNFPQNRLTDHRVNLTLYKLNSVMDGNLNELIDYLKKNLIA